MYEPLECYSYLSNFSQFNYEKINWLFDQFSSLQIEYINIWLFGVEVCRRFFFDSNSSRILSDAFNAIKLCNKISFRRWDLINTLFLEMWNLVNRLTVMITASKDFIIWMRFKVKLLQLNNFWVIRIYWLFHKGLNVRWAVYSNSVDSFVKMAEAGFLQFFSEVKSCIIRLSCCWSDTPIVASLLPNYLKPIQVNLLLFIWRTLRIVFTIKCFFNFNSSLKSCLINNKWSFIQRKLNIWSYWDPLRNIDKFAESSLFFERIEKLYNIDCIFKSW